MRRNSFDPSAIYVSDADAATLRQIATELGLDLPTARRTLGLDDETSDDELLRPRVAAVFRLVLEGWQP